MNVVNRELYVGTTWGCILVADAQNLQPITCFRCHGDESFYIKAIVPLMYLEGEEAGGEKQWNAARKRACQSVVTVGKGYRSLMHQHIPFSGSLEQEAEHRQLPFLLTWLADHWRTF